jgi:hypothetical protein
MGYFNFINSAKSLHVPPFLRFNYNTVRPFCIAELFSSTKRERDRVVLKKYNKRISLMALSYRLKVVPAIQDLYVTNNPFSKRTSEMS